jgi:hypothetical protein
MWDTTALDGHILTLVDTPSLDASLGRTVEVRGIPHLAQSARSDPDFLYAAPQMVHLLGENSKEGFFTPSEANVRKRGAKPTIGFVIAMTVVRMGNSSWVVEGKQWKKIVIVPRTPVRTWGTRPALSHEKGRG